MGMDFVERRSSDKCLDQIIYFGLENIAVFKINPLSSWIDKNMMIFFHTLKV